MVWIVVTIWQKSLWDIAKVMDKHLFRSRPEPIIQIKLPFNIIPDFSQDVPLLFHEVKPIIPVGSLIDFSSLAPPLVLHFPIGGGLTWTLRCRLSSDCLGALSLTSIESLPKLFVSCSSATIASLSSAIANRSSKITCTWSQKLIIVYVIAFASHPLVSCYSSSWTLPISRKIIPIQLMQACLGDGGRNWYINLSFWGQDETRTKAIMYGAHCPLKIGVCHIKSLIGFIYTICWAC